MRVAILHSRQTDPDHARGGRGASSAPSTREAPQAQPQQEPLPGSLDETGPDSVIGQYFRDAHRYPLLGRDAERALGDRLSSHLNLLLSLAQRPGITSSPGAFLESACSETNRSANTWSESTFCIRDVLAIWQANRDSAHSQAGSAIAGIEYCRQELIQGNLRLAVHIARRYQNLGLPLADLIQEANLGLMKAVERFDPGKGFKFSTYAYWWVSEEVKRAIKRGRSVVRTPDHVGDEIRVMQAVASRVQRELGRKPSRREVAEAIGASPARVEQLLGYAIPEVSTEAPMSQEGDRVLGDALPASRHWAPEYALFEHDRHRILATVLAQLKPREADVLQRRFGLRSGEVETLQEISGVLGISRERVRQIEKSALRTLQEKFADGLPGAADFL